MSRFLLALVLIGLAGCTPSQTNAEPPEPKVVIYAVHADWCAYCPRMYPTWRRFEKRNYDVRWIDADTSQIDEKYGVRVLPCTVVVKDGKAVKFEGVVSYERIDRYLRQ